MGEILGNRHLRLTENWVGGSIYVGLIDDRYDVIMLNESEIIALRDRLNQTIAQYHLSPDEQET